MDNPIPYPVTTLQKAHQIAGTLINQGIPERFRQTLILTLFQVLTQPEPLTPDQLIKTLPSEVILEAAEQLTAKVY